MAERVGTASRHAASGETAGGDEAHRRSVHRRRGLPGGRAATGGLLVAVAAVGLFAAAGRDGAPTRRSYVVARHALAAGTRLQASDLGSVSLDLTVELRTRAFVRAEPLLGATLVAPLGAGELVQASAVVARRGDAASREISFTLERGRVGSGIKEGERADLVATYGSGNDAFTLVVVRQALLVGLDRARTSAGDTGPATITVSVDDPADALALAHAVQLGKLTLVRATGAPPLPPVVSTYRVGKG